MFFMENVTVRIFPVRELLLVVARRLNWCVIFSKVPLLGLCAGTLLALVDFLIGGIRLHSVGVDDLGLLLEVPRILVVLSVGVLPRVLFLVVTDGHWRVGVPDEAIDAPNGLTVLGVAGRQLLEWSE